MNVTTMKAAVLRRCNQPASDYTHYPEADILAELNIAQNEIARITGCIQNVATLAVTAGTSVYSFETDMIEVKRLALDNVPLIQTTEASLDVYSKDWETDSNTPQFFIFYPPNQIKLIATPVASGTLRATYTQIPDELTSGSDIPDIQLMYHQKMVEYAVISWKISHNELPPNALKVWEDELYEARGNINSQQNRVAQVQKQWKFSDFRPTE